MPDSRSFHGISVLIPAYSVEDLPSDLNEGKASGLLNAAACAWHPALIAATGNIPEFRYADLSDIANAGQILLVPDCSEEWLGHDWSRQLDDRDCCLIHGLTERDEWLQAIESQSFGDGERPVRDMVDGFLSLGITHLILSILSRRMHHYIDPDRTRLTAATCAAAESALAGDTTACRQSLTDAFECLLETREQLYPVDISLADICLPGDVEQPELLSTAIESSAALNVLMSPSELNQLTSRDPHLKFVLDEALRSERCCIVSGGYDELRPSLGTLAALDADYERSRIQSSVTSGKRIWGQRRFGLLHSLPGLLKLFGYDFALHVALDEGTYPERELGSFRWTGPDQTTINATSRLPVAIDSASAFLRFPERLAESIQQDSAVLLMLARLPNLSTPWLDDLKRIESFVPVLGNFVMLSQFADAVDRQGTKVKFDAGEYLPTHLIQSAVLRTEAPITGPAGLFATWLQWERLAFLHAIQHILSPGTCNSGELDRLKQRLLLEESRRVSTGEKSDVDEQTQAVKQLAADIDDQANAAAERMIENLPTGDRPGLTVINTLPFARSVTVEWPANRSLPTDSESIAGIYRQNDQTIVSLQLPPGGFVQLPEASTENAASAESAKGRPLAEPGILRNQFFEVLMSDTTGGIAEVRLHNTRANRVSQQVAFRYESSRTIPATESNEARTVHYAQARSEQMRVLESGPWAGAIESRCVVEDVVDRSELFRFRQVTRVERTSRRVTIDVELQESSSFVTGNPWMTYIACRFAWDNEMAAVSRSVLGQACGFRGERFESPDFIEVADEDQRLLIVPHGRPYHRRSGNRMIDSLMVVEGEPERHFTFTLEFDQSWPMRSVRDLLQLPVIHPGAAVGSASGWILGVSSKNVQLGRVRCAEQPAESDSEQRPSLVLLLQETEGRRADCSIRTARQVTAARQRQPDGQTIQLLDISESGAIVEFRPFEIKEVELTF